MRVKGRWERFEQAHSVLSVLVALVAIAAVIGIQVVIGWAVHSNGWQTEAAWFVIGVFAFGSLLAVGQHFRPSKQRS